MAAPVIVSSRVELTAAAAAAAAGGTVMAGDGEARLASFSIDSRTLRLGDVFIAIVGDRFDGHRFASAAVDAGAAGLMLSDASAAAGLTRDVPVIRVDDTTKALQALGRHVRRASKAKVVAITGSAGKTTTKELTADLLALRFDVFRSQGNLNNHIGLPLSLLKLSAGPQVAVVELGMNHAGEISVLTAMAEPDVRVWLNVAEVHAEFFASIEGIADAKAEILEGATAATVVVANAGDPRVMARVRTSPARVVTFGLDVDADVRARDIRDLGVAGTRAVVTASGAEAEFAVPLVGRGHLANAVAAAAVATEFGVPLGDIAARIRQAAPASRRGEVRALRDGVTLIDDSYNSNPRALERMLQALAATAAPGRRFAVLGEMLELGTASAALHRACGRAAAAAGLAGLIAVGGSHAASLAAGAVEGGMPASSVEVTPTSQAAADRILEWLAAGDVVLVKGSRGIRTDIVADRILAAWGTPSGEERR
jgi:UDP-N-acetylmuramoyl-tripeptide--D-alanyl-D-alanine ligase